MSIVYAFFNLKTENCLFIYGYMYMQRITSGKCLLLNTNIVTKYSTKKLKTATICKISWSVAIHLLFEDPQIVRDHSLLIAVKRQKAKLPFLKIRSQIY